jgi:phosphoglycerol transferase MdoB-like AlkP superfamily enzyme
MPTAKSEFGILLQTLLWLLVTLVIYSLLRLEFLTWNWSSWFQTMTLSQWAPSFWNGLRFDLSSITWLSSLILLSALLPWPFISLQLKEQTLKTTFLLIHVPFILINAIDIEFIHFAGRRMTPDSFYLLRESDGKFQALWSTYWHLILGNLILLAAFIWCIRRLNLKLSPQSAPVTLFKKWPLRILFSAGFLVLLILFARGGIQPKPLEMAHAASISSDLRLIHLTLNSSFTTIHSLQKKRIARLNYFEDIEDLSPLLNNNTPGESIQPWSRKPKNVVLFVLESFGLEYTGLDVASGVSANSQKQSFTPFLDSLYTRSLYFSQGFANGRRSIESLPSLLAGIPSLLDEPFLTSTFQTNQIPRLGAELTNRGVWTGFFHGGANGTMFFQEFTSRLGFAHYFGKNEYPRSGDDDGSWGIWDGPFLTFFCDQISNVNSSFFATFFSLSSHHPFKVPETYRNQLPSGPLPILQSISYTDLMLREFFQKAAKTSWYADTLFIFTADHTSKSYLPEYQTPLGNFRVPILLYFPGAEFSEAASKLDLNEPAQHIDIFATIHELYGIDTPKTPLSRSLLRTGPRKASLYLDGQHLLVDKSGTLILPTEGTLPSSNDPRLPSWKAHRQYFINGMIDNKL